uniref:DH domain-containing protein n=1 Tax=Latimeria chalumnae TaxID=7897 RepID=H2ZUX7_LATCH
EDVADKRTVFAKEILSSERNYVQMLEIVRDIYVMPLKCALASNRAILSVANVQIICSDILEILDLNRHFLDELKVRLQEWGPSQCLGDVFVKFSSRLKTYTNYFNNYTTILKTIDKCRESIPPFRAFLKRHDKTLVTKMLSVSLQELLLWPSRRFEEYVTLLYAVRLHSLPEHIDRDDLTTAIKQLKQYRDYIRQLRLNIDRDNQMLEAQKIIQGCPPFLSPGNSGLLRNRVMLTLWHCVIHNRIYEHVSDLCLFLFNDALVIAARNVSHLPFEKACRTTYQFSASVSLHRLFVEDIPDSKCKSSLFPTRKYAPVGNSKIKDWSTDVKNAFILQGPKRKWICATEAEDSKFTWLSILESAVNAAI